MTLQRIAITRAATGLAQGFALYFLYRATEAKLWPATDPQLFSPLLMVSVFVPHATAGVALIETGSGSESDLVEALDRLLPRDRRWQHHHGTEGHGADHVLPAFVAPSITIPVIAGRLTLGTWQSVVLVDLNRDNPMRSVRLSFMPG